MFKLRARSGSTPGALLIASLIVTAFAHATPARAADRVVGVMAPLPGTSSPGRVRLLTAPVSGRPAPRPVATPRSSPSFVPIVSALRLHPQVRAWLADSSAGERDTFIVTLRDTVTLRAFPVPPLTATPDSLASADYSKTVGQRIASVELRRAPFYRADSTRLVTRYHAAILNHYWIFQGVRLAMSRNDVEQMWRDSVVRYVAPQFELARAPACGTASSGAFGVQVKDARCRLASDAYRDLNLPTVDLALLDTGIRETHQIFHGDGGGSLGKLVNCFGATGTPTIAWTLQTVPFPVPLFVFSFPFNFNFTCWITIYWEVPVQIVDTSNVCDVPWTGDLHTLGHGTCSAAILIGGGALGANTRGLTNATLDGYQVFRPLQTGESEPQATDRHAVVRAIELAAASEARVILVETQEIATEWADVSVAANHAFDLGCAVIAPVGNLTSGSEPGFPARARKVMGAGAIDVQSGSTDMGQRSGVVDQRLKPDVQAPTSTKTAGNGTSDTYTRYYSGTSGAAPYVAGAGALLWSWMRRQAANAGNEALATEPGHLYAGLVLSGAVAGDFSAANKNTGAGPIRLPLSGYLYWGAVDVLASPGEETFTFSVDAGNATSLEVAAWWAAPSLPAGEESGAAANMDFTLIAPNGEAVATARSTLGVFEHIRFEGGIASGEWTVRIDGITMPAGKQRVFVAAALRVP